MSSFVRVRSKAEIDKLIDTVTKNKKTLQDAVTDDVVGSQFTQAETIKSQKPLLQGLDKIVSKIDERLAPPNLDALGNPVIKPDGSIDRKSFIGIMGYVLGYQQLNNHMTSAINTDR